MARNHLLRSAFPGGLDGNRRCVGPAVPPAAAGVSSPAMDLAKTKTVVAVRGYSAGLGCLVLSGRKLARPAGLEPIPS